MLLVEGPNGSGKTSLLKAIAGLIDLESGALEWRGIPTAKEAQTFRASLAWFSHRSGFKAELTPLENLRFESGLRVFNSTDYLQALNAVDVAETAKLPMRVLSAGQQRRVGLARMVLSDAPLWILDEPFTNLDTAGQALVRKLLADHLAADGLAVVASHQDIDIDVNTQRLKLT